MGERVSCVEWVRERRRHVQPATVKLERLLFLMGIDYMFGQASGDWVEVGVRVGAHGG